MSSENEFLTRYSGLQKSLQYQFKNIFLLDLALTHSSWANEHANTHNERLEFLGDAVLELNISAELYRRFPTAREGILTKFRSLLVSEKKLAEIALKLNLPQYLHIGRGEEVQGGRLRPALIADAVEALLGAVYLDGGQNAAFEVISLLYKNSWSSLDDSAKVKDPKSRLQELTQAVLHTLPVYAFIGSEGPDHAKTFKVSLTLSNGSVYYATGSNIKGAEHTAAAMALQALAEENHPREMPEKQNSAESESIYTDTPASIHNSDRDDNTDTNLENTEQELPQSPQRFFLGKKQND